MSALVFLAPYVAIMIYAWDRRRTLVGALVCASILIVEIVVWAHLWLVWRVA